MTTVASWHPNRRSIIALASLVLLASVALTAAWALNPAGAQNPPGELTLVCIHQGSDKIAVLAVDSAAECNANNETLFVLPDDGPINACAQANNGLLRYVGSQTSCSGNDTFVAFPGAGPTYLCAGSGNGDLRLVSAPSQCSSTETPYVVSPANAAPDALDQAVNVDEDDSVVITLEATDPDGDTLTFAIADGPDNGSLGAVGAASCDGNTPSTCTADVTYTPDPGYVGPDSFTFSATDPDGLSDTATVSITVAPVNDPPVVAPKAYDAQTNIGLDVPASDGLLEGVTDPDDGVNGFVAEFTVTAGPTTPADALLDVDPADGSFTFTPPPGYTGDVTFDYTVCDNGDPLPSECAGSTVTITVSGPVIWFVDDGAAPGGTGTLTAPFDTLAGAAAAIGADTNERVFLFSGSYAGGIALTAGGWLIGQGVSGAGFDAVLGITPPAFTVDRPAISGGAPVVGNTVTLNDNTVVRGIALDTGADTALNDTAGATDDVTVDEVSVTTTTGSGVVIDGLSVGSTFAISGLDKSGPGGVGVSLTGGSGAFTFADVTVTGAAGVALTGNAAATVSFDGLSLDTGANAAFEATGGGTVTATGSNTLTTTTATALRVEDAAIGAGGLNFASISSDGAASAIVLADTTGSTGRLVVGPEGAGGACDSAVTCAGGAILNATGEAISLTNTGNVSFTELFILESGDHAVAGTGMADVTAGAEPTFLMANSFLAGAGDGNGDSALFFDAMSGATTNITGTLTVADTTIKDFEEVGIHVGNNAGVLTVNLTNLTVNNNSDVNGEEGVDIDALGSANTTVNVSGGTYTDLEGGAFLFTVTSGAGVIDVNVDGATITGTGGPDNFPTPPVVTLLGEGETSTLTFDITNNAILDGSGDGIFIGQEGAIMGRVTGNEISGMATGDGIRIDTDTTGTAESTILIDNNDIGNVAGNEGIGDDGIQVLHRDGAKTLNLTITNNRIANTASEAIRYFADDDVTADGPENRVLIANNALSNIGDSANAILIISQDPGTNVCTDITGNTGVSGITLQQSLSAVLSITQASAAALATANGGATVTPSGTITFSTPCTVPAPTNP